MTLPPDERSNNMRRKVIRRDRYGRPYLDQARADDEDVGDVRDVLRPGERLHVPMYLKDSGDAWREDMHRHLGDAGADTLVINTSGPPMVVDVFGGTGALNRPGARYAAAGDRTVDHAVLTTLAVMRDEAYRLYDQESQSAWRGNESADAAPTPDTVEAAYADYDREMSDAWRKTR
jgi:hypothetical protein